MTTSNESSAVHCAFCGSALALPEGPVSRSASCMKCLNSVRVCRNCQHYDPQSYNECHEPSAERVVDKDKANFCDYFALGGKHGGSGPSKEDILKQADCLFKK